jgi:hypothetical protein
MKKYNNVNFQIQLHLKYELHVIDLYGPKLNLCDF